MRVRSPQIGGPVSPGVILADVRVDQYWTGGHAGSGSSWQTGGRALSILDLILYTSLALFSMVVESADRKTFQVQFQHQNPVSVPGTLVSWSKDVHTFWVKAKWPLRVSGLENSLPSCPCLLSALHHWFLSKHRHLQDPSAEAGWHQKILFFCIHVI